MKEKFIKKWMRVARLIGEDQNPCHSRKIGAIIVEPKSNRILGTGYNGPPPGTPHPESAEYLREYFWPQLTDDEKQSLKLSLLTTHELQSGLRDESSPITDEYLCNRFVETYQGKPICPRRLVRADTGQRTDLCSCGHAERHAITNAAQSCLNCYMFCWCGVPCLQCTDAIIQAGIIRVYCLDVPDYHSLSRWLFHKAGVLIIQYPIGWYNEQVI